MTVSERIRSQITAADYATCWAANTPPPFSAFVDFTCNAFEKQLPAGFAELVVKISARAENRIGLGGSFVSDSVLYEIFGDIVWLPKMNMFRGRPGFNESLRTVSLTDDVNDSKFEFRPLSELNTSIHFRTWTGYPTKPAIDNCRKTLRNTITELLDLENQSDYLMKTTIIRKCIHSFNAINERFENFIDTDLREQIIDAVYEIALASGLDPKISEELDDWREW